MGFDCSIVTAPERPAVEIADAAAYLRQSDPAELEAIAGYVAAATELAQEFLGQQFIRATRLQRFDSWADLLRDGLAYPPLVSVTHVKYLDEAGVEQTLSASLYTTRATVLPGRIQPGYNATWPTHQQVGGAVRVTYLCGYGLAASDVPATIRAGIGRLVAAMYDGAEVVLGDTIKALLSMAGRYTVV